MTLQTNLINRDGMYYFRTRVPTDLVARCGRGELKRSLNTKVATVAKDGTPHLHVMLYFEARNLGVIDEVITNRFPEPDDRKDGSKRVASSFVVMDRTKGKASTYMMKYLVKTLGWAADGVLPAGEERSPINSEDYGLEDRDGIAAWRAERGGKTFGFIGLAQGIRTIWAKLASRAAQERVGAVAAYGLDPTMSAITALMREKCWPEALEALDAVLLLRADETVANPMPVATVFEGRTSRYGELYAVPVGVAPVGDLDAGIYGRPWQVRSIADGGDGCIQLSKKEERGAREVEAEGQEEQIAVAA